MIQGVSIHCLPEAEQYCILAAEAVNYLHYHFFSEAHLDDLQNVLAHVGVTNTGTAGSIAVHHRRKFLSLD